MNSKSTIQKIKEKFEEFGIEINKEYKTKDEKEDVILADNITITSDQKDIFVSFDINSNPSYAARIILILKDIKGIRNFYIGDDYTIDKQGKLLDGKEAMEYYRKYQKEDIINEYVQQQSQAFYLAKAKHYHC